VPEIGATVNLTSLVPALIVTAGCYSFPSMYGSTSPPLFCQWPRLFLGPVLMHVKYACHPKGVPTWCGLMFVVIASFPPTIDNHHKRAHHESHCNSHTTLTQLSSAYLTYHYSDNVVHHITIFLTTRRFKKLVTPKIHHVYKYNSPLLNEQVYIWNKGILF
jgi:hypothetical protein